MRFDLRWGGPPGSPWLACRLHLVRVTAESRGWQPCTRRAMQRVLAGHRDGEAIAASAVHAVVTRHSLARHMTTAVWEGCFLACDAVALLIHGAPSTVVPVNPARHYGPGHPSPGRPLHQTPCARGFARSSVL